MTKRKRLIILLTCLLLFIIIAPSAVFYSQGYRIDFKNKKITQTGGLFLKVVPRQVNVYIDGKLNKRTDFFFGSILVENLLPKKYKIEVKRENYHPWQKTLEMKEREVTEAKNVILFPEEVNFNILFNQIEDFWFFPDQRKVVLKEKEETGWSLKLYDLDRNIKSHLINKEDFIGDPQLISLDFSKDLTEIYLKIIDNENQKKETRYFVLEIDQPKSTLTEKEPPPLKDKNIITYKQVNNHVYYLNDSGHLFRSEADLNSFPPSFLLDDNLRERERLTEDPFLIKEKDYDLEIFQGFIFLQENDNLYKFNRQSESFEIFFEGVNFLKISPDRGKLAYSSNHEIWILSLKDNSDPPGKKSGEKLLLIRLSEPISNLAWVNSNYLTFTAQDKIKISEIDERDKINIVDIFETKKLPRNGRIIKIFFNQFDKKIYLLEESGILYNSSVLVP